jgi:hypothetical protein
VPLAAAAQSIGVQHMLCMGLSYHAYYNAILFLSCSELLVVDAAQTRGWSTKFSLAAVNTALVRLPAVLCCQQQCNIISVISMSS